ncbi:MAG: DNA-binding response regulator, partial [Deltaproteobacteria bacterium]|nr:DNA-binding response regulator [Deltaproteobacteria bacterium]
MTDIYILLADNDPVFLTTCAEFLNSAGYRVRKAASPMEVRQILEVARVHLVVLDLRLTNDDDQKDRSGLTLAKEAARSVPKLIHTKFPTHQDVREALKLDTTALPPAIDFVDKREGLNGLLTAVKQAFTKHVRINWDLVIRWDERERLSSPHLATLIEPDLDSANLPDRAGEMEDLFRKLFYEQGQITIGRLLWRQEGRACVTVFAYSPKGTLEQLVVTCGLRPQIEQEIARCEEFTPKGGTATALLTPAETMHFAAAAYVLPEADLEQVQTYEAFYRVNKATQIRGVLEHLFQTTLVAWHRGSRILDETKSLSQLYLERLNFGLEEITQEELQRRTRVLAKEALSLGPTTIELSADELTLRFPNSDTVSYPNPIPHIYEEAVADCPPVVCRITPGTLSGNNILVDQQGRTWLTDFAQARPAPLLWDFVSLEVITRFDLVESADLQALHEFEKRLVTPTRLNERLYIQDIDPQFRKALSVVQEIRRLAFQSGGGDPIPYYKGLLFRAMSSVAGYDPDLKHTRQELARLAHALLAAAMIWGKMMQVAQASRGGASVSARGIRIDEASRQVWVEGRQVKLSSSEFDLLLCLHNNAGRVCTRRLIVEEALGG